MRPFTALSLLLALSGSAFSAPAPENDLKIRNVDECKAVTVIISVLSQYKASATSFCSSFISIPVKTVTSATTTTSTPKPSTVTSTITVTPKVSVTATTTTTPTVIYSITSAPAKRAISPKLAERNINNQPIPSYVSAFASSEISSACSCLSISPSTTTVKTTSTVVGPAPTTVVKTTITASTVTTTISTVTVTASSTVTECANALPTFILKLASPVVLNGAQLEGTYDQIDDGDGELVGFNGLTDPSAAGVLSLTSTGFLMIDSVGQIAFRIPGQTGLQLLLFDPPAEVEASDTPVVCSVATGALTCSDGVNSVLQLCPGFAVTDDLFIGPVVASGCVGVVLDVLPVCIVP
ncbi:hypothetical protein HO173_005452 [Letharia columbiana]|uniref:Uncharacterized protein n=1 Tax=Letharia columbiana TaxID=112416 RepID=A0A8H6FWY6_9LECA|nr:uncharacterized protein HO173_005452 [Letharia columbiana]KAF6236361.1 hypothetical protein HO173_005452 [Letharia columbiana]